MQPAACAAGRAPCQQRVLMLASASGAGKLHAAQLLAVWLIAAGGRPPWAHRLARSHAAVGVQPEAVLAGAAVALPGAKQFGIQSGAVGKVGLAGGAPGAALQQIKSIGWVKQLHACYTSAKRGSQFRAGLFAHRGAHGVGLGRVQPLGARVGDVGHRDPIIRDARLRDVRSGTAVGGALQGGKGRMSPP